MILKKKSPKLFVYLCQIVTNLQNSKRDQTKNSNCEEKKLKKSNCDKTQTSPFWKQTQNIQTIFMFHRNKIENYKKIFKKNSKPQKI